MSKITVHCLVKNEENFIWYAVMSVKDWVEKIIIYDTGSEDETVEIIKTIKDPKIGLKEKGKRSPRELVELRNEMIMETRTPWFLLLDGDEVWPKETIKEALKMIENASPEKVAGVLRTRNCVGDSFHYLPEEQGDYRILGMKGHFNIRLYRTAEAYRWKGVYPLEAYVDDTGEAVNFQDDKLLFLDKYIWHLTHLPRSRFGNHGRQKFELGIPFPKGTVYPEVFSLKPSAIIPSLKKRTRKYLFFASLLAPLRFLKRRLIRQSLF